jgi:hypothetical protein
MTDQQYPEQSQATTALVLGIIGLVCCWVLAPVAWWLGRKEVMAIDAGRRPPENRGNARTGKILGIIGTIVLVLAIPLGSLGVARNFDEFRAGFEEGLPTGTEPDRSEDGEAGTLSVYDLEVGDCGDFPPDADLYLSVTVHPCDTPHDFEVYDVRDMPDGPDADYPGDDAVLGFADQGCLAAFEGYVGVAWDDSPDLTYTYLYPSEETWDEGDREVLCTLTHVDEGTQLVGSKRDAG